ncbi:uncharacterized protein A4U43_C02F5190 [Asparagus officinalis]|uniref:Uncharacterized protein n=1 Tax=Asparagus officinalis TaxID=4686 RepID=A0A5P1FIS0_ASPOF|nr:uncharacterized protein LOC109830176 [Asparagus officinalis]ONK77307.1 uncharacterized protein A4U43_C02F5190 [Asparagus officinalis]
MEPSTDLQDWELLNESDSGPNPKPKPCEPLDSDDGAINPDYFSLSPIKSRQSEDEIDEGGVDSDNPSWLDPDSDSRYHSIKDSRSFSSDESSEELGFEKKEAVGDGELGKDGSLDGSGVRVWWRMPLEVLKVWVLRARPVWSISIAAAIIGVLMLGRKLYKMKQKGRSIPLKIAIDDKRASQFIGSLLHVSMKHSPVMKRAPLIRPSLPTSSLASWPMASLR